MTDLDQTPEDILKAIFPPPLYWLTLPGTRLTLTLISLVPALFALQSPPNEITEQRLTLLHTGALWITFLFAQISLYTLNKTLPKDKQQDSGMLLRIIVVLVTLIPALLTYFAPTPFLVQNNFPLVHVIALWPTWLMTEYDIAHPNEPEIP